MRLLRLDNYCRSLTTSEIEKERKKERERERERARERDEIRKVFFRILYNLFLSKEIIFQQKYVLDFKNERETSVIACEKQF